MNNHMNKSVNNIIDALGGTSKLANLLGVNPSAVSNYRQKGFPARLHLKIIALCEEFSIPIDNEFIDKSKIPLKVIKSNSYEFLTQKSNSIMSSLSSDGYQLVDPPILVPADKVIDRLGETIVDRLFIFSQKDGIRLCLRPDLTIPTCLYYLGQGFKGEKKLYSYFGKVFQFYDEEENEPNEFTQTGIESIGDQNLLSADVEIFVKIYNALKKEGINNFRTYFGDVSLFQEFINVLDIPELWKKNLLEKFWNEDEFKVLLDEISKKNFNNDEFAERVYSLDIESALELVRGNINLSDRSFFAGRSLEEITDRLRKKGESYSLKPLSDSTKKLITEFLSIKDKPSLAIIRLRKLCKSLDGSLLNKIDEAEKRFEIIQSTGVDFQNAIFGAEKGRDVEYYSGFLYDFAWSNNNESIYIGGGGRYDNLIKLLGSENRIPAVGAALNLKKVERISQIESL